MKKLFGLLMLAAPWSWGAVNQLDFNFGRGSPLSSLQAGQSSDRQGGRGDAWSADFLHRTGPRLYIGIGGGHFRSGDNVSATFVTDARSTLTSRVTSIFFLTRTDLGRPARMTPYLIAGIGWVRNSLSVAAAPNSTWTNTGTAERRTLLEDSKETLGYASGIGMDYLLNDRLIFGIEARYQGALKKTFALTSAGQTTTGSASFHTPVNIFLWGLKVGIKY